MSEEKLQLLQCPFCGRLYTEKTWESLANRCYCKWSYENMAIYRPIKIELSLEEMAEKYNRLLERLEYVEQG